MGNQTSGLLSPYLQKRRIEAAKPYLRGRILDYGCGSGILTEICDSDSYLGVDVDEKCIAEVRDSYPEYRFETSVSRIEKFDTIALLAVIEHVSDPGGLLAELKQMLKPEGCLVLTTPVPSVEWVHTLGSRIGLFDSRASEEHNQLLNYEMIDELANKAGLVIEKYKRFLFRLNQLFILRRKEEGDLYC